MSLRLRAIPVQQVLDYVSVEAMLHRPDRPGQIKLAARKLSEFPQVEDEYGLLGLTRNVDLLASGQRIPRLPSIFHDVPGPRHGKDACYETFWQIVERHLPLKENRYYIGLPANQIGQVYWKVARMQSCERDRKMLDWQRQYRKIFHLEDSRLQLSRTNIFECMSKPRNRFRWNVLDLDLMCTATPELVEQIGISCSLATRKDSPVVLNLTTSIGRNITKEQYAQLLPGQLLMKLKSLDLNILETHSGYYRDRCVPQSVEHIVFVRK